MDEQNKITDAKVVSETKTETTQNSETKAEPNTTAAAKLPWKPFLAGIIVALIGFQLYNVITAQTAIPDNAAAVVNGFVITEDELAKGIEQTAALATQQGVDISDPSAQAILREQALTVLVNTRLLIEAAIADGHVPSDEKIDEQLAVLEAQFGGKEALQAQVDSLGLSAEDLRQEVSEQVSVDAYIRAKVDVDNLTATDEEINTVYEALIAQGQEMPELEVVRDGIAAQLEGQKQSEAINALVESLRAEAEIEIVS